MQRRRQRLRTAVSPASVDTKAGASGTCSTTSSEHTRSKRRPRPRISSAPRRRWTRRQAPTSREGYRRPAPGSHLQSPPRSRCSGYAGRAARVRVPGPRSPRSRPRPSPPHQGAPSTAPIRPRPRCPVISGVIELAGASATDPGCGPAAPHLGQQPAPAAHVQDLLPAKWHATFVVNQPFAGQRPVPRVRASAWVAASAGPTVE